MTQNILTVDIDEFRAAIAKIESTNLLNLLWGLLAEKWITRGEIPDQLILDIARKESIIQKELQRRGFINKDNMKEYEEEYRRRNYRRTIYY